MKRSLMILACMLFVAGWCVPLAHAQSAGDADTPAPKKKDNGKKNQKKPDEKQAEEGTKLPAYTGPKKRVAVLDLEVKITATSTSVPTPSGGTATSLSVDIPVAPDFGTGMTEMLTTALINTNRFILIERKNFKDIQDEQALNKTEGFDQTSTAKSGGLLGAQLLVRGAITEFAYKKLGTGVGGVLGKAVDVSKGSTDASVVLDIRLYDTTTGQIIDSVKAEGRVKSTASTLNFNKGDIKLGTSSFSNTPLGHATREAIDKAVKFICDRMEARPWESRVGEVEQDNGKTTDIYIIGGGEVGLKVNDELEVFRPGRPIIDPDTRVVVSRTKGKIVGRCRIDSIEKSLSIAKPISGEGFQIGDVVRFPSAEASK